MSKKIMIILIVEVILLAVMCWWYDATIIAGLKCRGPLWGQP